MIDTLQKVLRFETVTTDALPGMPFGKNNADCLAYVLKKGEEMGFKSYNCDNYAGHLDFAADDKNAEVFGVLGHLDVVPVTEGWIAPPFGGEIIDGKIYGRGTMDDKGPMIACLYAAKALKMSGFRPRRTLRLIFGCDEENNMACIKYYKTKVKMPDLAISPDGDFPVINVEKGIYAMELDVGKVSDAVLDISAGSRTNVVPDLCTALVDKSLDLKPLEKFNVEVKEADGRIQLLTRGKSTHGAMPHTGVNATWEMFRALSACLPDDKTLAFVAEKMCRDVNGKAWGFPLEDEVSGKITHSIGVVSLKNGNLKIKLDVRYPVTYKDSFVAEAMKKNSIDSFKIEEGHIKQPLHVDAVGGLQQGNELRRQAHRNRRRHLFENAAHVRCFRSVFPRRHAGDSRNKRIRVHRQAYANGSYLSRSLRKNVRLKNQNKQRERFPLPFLNFQRNFKSLRAYPFLQAANS